MYVNYSKPKMTDWTEESVAFELATNTEWTERAIVMLYLRQTEMERTVNETLNKNTVGFQRADVLMFSRYARKIQNGEHLSEAELAFVRRPWRRAKVPQPTICKYRIQVLDMIEEAARRKAR